jgi:hypothetical protein
MSTTVFVADPGSRLNLRCIGPICEGIQHFRKTFMITRTAEHRGTIQLPLALRNLAELALLLERVEGRGTTPDALQYRSLIEHISAELDRQPRDEALDRLLAAFPATGELYENLRYASSGLCLLPLEQSVESEQQTTALLQRLAKAAPSAP